MHLVRTVGSSIFLLTLGLNLVSIARAENWPQWRGPKNDGISTEKNVPVKWSKTENIAWRLPLPGIAGATPCVWGDRIFLTSAKGEDELIALCVGTDGKILWERSLGGGNRAARGNEGNRASPSPSTDGKHVYAFTGNGNLYCFDFAGSEVWKVDIQKDYGKFDIQFGMASTPVLYEEGIYLQLIHGDGKAETREAQTLALDKRTGKLIWKQDRPSEAVIENEHSYASPTIYHDEKQAFLVTHGADYTIAHSLADGHELWRKAGLNPREKYNNQLRLVASPVAVPGLIVAPSAKNGPVLGMAPDGQLLWSRKDNTPDVPSPLVAEGIVYLCRENGVLITLDRKTGKEIYSKPAARGDYRASPVWADGKLYMVNRNGTVTVIKAGEQFEVLSVNKLEETLSASPAISNGRIYLRTFDALYAIGPDKPIAKK